MGHKIDVDTSLLVGTSEAVGDYADTVNLKMKAAGAELEGLTANWSGADAAAFCGKWEAARGEGSVSGRMVAALRNYADFLKYAAEEYEKTARTSTARAEKLR